MELGILVFIHVLGASIWVGGHLILAIGFLPRALKENSFEIIEQFESRYEKIGIPALIVQILTGVRLAMIFVPKFADWFSFSTRTSAHIFIKLILLALTVLLAFHAKKFVHPKKNLKLLAAHIILVTLLAVLLVYFGVSINTGGLV